MGENLIRRRNDRFKYQRDASLVKHLTPDLFSRCPPETVVSVYGTQLGELADDQTLWTPTVHSDGPIDFFCGDRLAVRLEGPAAEYIRSEHRDARTPVLAVVTHVERAHRLVTLRVGNPQ